MIEEMKYINIMGPAGDLDRVSEKYLSKYNVQLEYTIKELSTEKGLVPFSEPNPYAAILKQARKLVQMTGLEPIADIVRYGKASDITREAAIEVIEYANGYFDNISKNINEVSAKRDDLKSIIANLEPFEDMDFRIDNLSKFQFIKYRFGRMQITSFKQFEAFLYKDSEILFEEGKRDADFVWGVYFAAGANVDKVDSMFSSLHFEKIELPEAFDGESICGTPKEALAELKHKLDALERFIKSSEQAMMEEADSNKDVKFSKNDILSAYDKLKSVNHSFDVRKYAAKTTNDFYIIVGWMTKKDAKTLEADLSEDKKVVFIVEDNNDSIISIPPTKLKNPFIVRPFEFFVKMYGLPDYNEIDPTPFVALTYTILFGIMFGDIGQGIVLFLLGAFLFAKKGLELGKIMSIIGVSSAFFGLLFGSFFGFEFHGLWMHPADPANINNILLYAVGFGIFLIITSMTLNIANALRSKKLIEILFDPNGIAGAVFYIALIVIAVSALTGNGHIAGWVIALFIVLPIVLIAFREPFNKLMSGKKQLVHGSVPLYLFETVIELFEVVLNYFTNTVSFVRVGAFALSHACMMSVVLMLSQTASGSNNILVIILGNILVMALEGLIVGIQVLRLEFYEMFSRFYKGSGRAFEPYKES